MKRLLLITLAMLTLSTGAMAQKQLPDGYAHYIPGKWMKDGKFRFTFRNEDDNVEIYTTDLVKTHSITANEYCRYRESRYSDYTYLYSHDITEQLGTLDIPSDYDIYSRNIAFREKLKELGYHINNYDFTSNTVYCFNYGQEKYYNFNFNGDRQDVSIYNEAFYLDYDNTFGKCRLYRVNYNSYYGDWSETDKSYYSDLPYSYLLDQDDCGYDIDDTAASQIFFNSDEDLEYVRYKFTNFDLYEDELYPNSKDIPAEIIPHLVTRELIYGRNEHWIHEYGQRPTAIEVVNTSGKVLHTLNLPEGARLDNDDISFIKTDGNIFAIVEVILSNGGRANLLYDLSASSDAVLSIRTNPKDNNHRYNLAGQRVGDDFKGVVIQNGRKVLRK